MSKIRLAESSQPSTPASGKYYVWLDSADNHLKQIDDTGKVIDLAGDSLDKWVANTSYEVDDVIWLEVDGKIYVCTIENSDAIFDADNWDTLSSSMSDVEIKTAYENNADTNEFTDAEKTKLGNYIDQNVTSGSSPTFDGNNFTGIDANDVDIADAGALITATNVEAALQENRAAIDLNTNDKADLASPIFTGTPAAPTAGSNTNTTQIATTAFVQTELTDLIGGAPGALDTLNELAAAINDDSSYASTITTALGNKVSTSSSQALSASANAMTIDDHTITLARADGSTDTVVVPDTDTTYVSSDFTHDDLTGFVSNEHIDWTSDQGATNIHTGNYTDTTYSVQDGGLTQKNFTTTLKSKLDGIASSANNYSHPNHTGDVTSSGDGAQTIANNAVTLAKMASGTDGNLITYDASGDPAYVSTGTAEQVLTSNGTGAAPTFQDASGGGSGLPQLMPDNMSLDDTNIEVARGSAFSMVETLDYDSTSADGSAWIIFNFPSSLDAGTDIDLDIYYHLSGSDNSKVVVFKTEYWCKAIGEAPNPASADGSNSDNISTGTGEDGEIRKVALTAIPNASIAAGDTITLKLTREGSNGTDTYTGTFQLLYIIPSQS